MCMGRPKNIIVINETYRELAEYFYRYLLRLGYNPKSSKARYNYLCEFLSWLECQGHSQIENTTPKQITDYYRYLSERPSKKDGGTLNQKTTHGHMRIIRDLFIMLQNEGKVKTNPCSTLKFPYPKGQDVERTILSQKEIQTLYHFTQTAQERAILSLAYGCGLRVGELTACNIEDIRLREKILIVAKGKGNKRRVVPMSSGVVKDLADYYYTEREALTKGRDYNAKETAFMLHSRGGRMHKYTYNKYLKQIIDRTEDQAIWEKNITIHSLRHSIATHLLAQGVPVEQVRMFLGHSQLETTQLYTHISKEQLQNLMQ